MILTDIRGYLRLNKRVTLADLATHFRCTPDAMRGMLSHWITKGKVQYIQGNPCSKGCCKVEDPTLLEFYEWVE